jgi:hypothetical protein
LAILPRDLVDHAPGSRGASAGVYEASRELADPLSPRSAPPTLLTSLLIEGVSA